MSQPGPWARWRALLDRVEPGATLALFRIACGLCVILTIGWVVHADLVDVIWLDLEHGGYRSLGGGPWPVWR